jgi:hypothetical protein
MLGAEISFLLFSVQRKTKLNVVICCPKKIILVRKITKYWLNIA